MYSMLNYCQAIVHFLWTVTSHDSIHLFLKLLVIDHLNDNLDTNGQMNVSNNNILTDLKKFPRSLVLLLCINGVWYYKIWFDSDIE